MSWSPPRRAPWVEKLVAYGRGLGDDGRSLIPLGPDDLLAAATAATGLDDVGDDWFKAPLDRLCRALEEEAALHLAGRLRARAELQVILQNRLRLVAHWRAEPTVADEVVEAPVVVTGLGRSGTTLLHELLALDPGHRAPRLWEMLHTPLGPDADDDPSTVAVADGEITLMDEMVPAFTSMHENRGHLPTECIFLFAHQFSSDLFTGLYSVPSYTLWRSGIDDGPAYRWHRAMLQTLQWRRPGRRFVLKAPSHLSSLDLLFATYPDAQVVVTHRDPLRVVGSLADMMASLHWMHSHRADYQPLVEFLCMGLELQMVAVTRQRDEGGLPPSQITDVRYADLVRDPVATVEALYRGWDRPLVAEFRARLDRYVAGRHRGRATGHDYRFADTGLDVAEHRAALAEYQERFAVVSEV